MVDSYNEIKKAMGCHADCDCSECTLAECKVHDMTKNIFDLINHLKEENERLNVELVGMRGAANSYKMHYDSIKMEAQNLKSDLIMQTNNYEYTKGLYDRAVEIGQKMNEKLIEAYKKIKTVRSEGVKDFWDRLKKQADFISGGDYGISFEIREDVAEEIIKEMTDNYFKE